MKVLHLFDWYLPSTLSWTSRLLDQLKSCVEPAIAAPWIVDGPFAHPDIPQHLFPPQKWFFPTVKTEWEHPFWQRVFARSQRFIPTYPCWLCKRLVHNPPDILHAHFGPTGCLYLPLAQKLVRPLVVTFYGFDYQKILHKRPVFKEKYQRLFKAAEKVVCASPTGAAALENMGCPGHKIAIVPPGPDLQRFPFVARTKQPEQLRLVQVATFTPKKGHLTTIEAFAMAAPHCPGLHLTLAGERYDPATVRAVERLIRQHDLADRIDWLNFVPHADMPTFLTKFDAFVQPSQTTPEGDHEATPVALLEAMATGLPVLATRHFDLPDMVLDGQTGFLSAEKDAAGLARSMEQMWRMEATDYQIISQNAQQHVARHFDVAKSAELLLRVYEEIRP